MVHLGEIVGEHPEHRARVLPRHKAWFCLDYRASCISGVGTPLGAKVGSIPVGSTVGVFHGRAHLRFVLGTQLGAQLRSWGYLGSTAGNVLDPQLGA